MARQRNKTPLKSVIERLVLGAFLIATSACGNGGHIDFIPEYISKTNRAAGFNIVPGSKALVVESGKTTDTGYHAKIQLSPLKGTKLTAASGHSMQLKFTVRTRQ